MNRKRALAIDNYQFAGSKKHKILPLLERIDNVVILSIVVQNNNSFAVLQCLSGACRALWNTAKHVIQRLFFFSHKTIPYKLYNPQKLKHVCQTMDLSINITHITFHERFNTPITSLPPRLTRLSFPFHCDFSQNIAYFPPGLTHLSFGQYFNKPLPSFPESLQYLTLGGFYNHPLPFLPLRLAYLCFDDTIISQFNHPLPNFPSSLTHLTLGWSYNHPLPPHDPATLLHHLEFGGCFNQSVANLPPTLSLTLGVYFNSPLESLRSGLKSLTLSSSFNQTVDMLPDSITHLTLGKGFNYPIHVLPRNLQLLALQGYSTTYEFAHESLDFAFQPLTTLLDYSFLFHHRSLYLQVHELISVVLSHPKLTIVLLVDTTLYKSTVELAIASTGWWKIRPPLENKK